MVIVSLGIVILFLENLIGKKVRKQLGHPCKIGVDRIQYYLSRDDLPLEDIIRIAKTEIIFVSVSHEVVAPDKRHVIREAIVNRNITVRILLLDPESHYVPYKECVFGLDKTDKSLRSRIQESLSILCKVKDELSLEKKDNMIIQTYNSDIPYSIMIIDHGTDNACIKVEQHPLESEEFDRQNRVVFWKDSQEWYNEYFSKYEALCVVSSI